MKRSLIWSAAFCLLVCVGPVEAKRIKREKRMEAASAEMASMTSSQLVATIFSDPEKVEQFKLRYQAKNEIILRGADAEILAGLLRVCEQGDVEKIRLAMETLLELRSKELVPVLAHYLLSDNTTLSGISLEYLEQIADSRVESALTAFYHKPGKEGYWPRCVIVLGKIKAIGFAPVFKGELTDYNLASPAALALAEMGDPSGRETARKALQDSKHGLDTIALRALGYIGNRSDLGLVDDMVKKFQEYQGSNADWGKVVHFQIETNGQPIEARVAKLAALLELNLSHEHYTLIDWAIDYLEADGGPVAMKELTALTTGPVPLKYRKACAQVLRNHGYKVTYQKGGLDYAFTVSAKPDMLATSPSVAFDPASAVNIATPTPEPVADLGSLSDKALLAAFKEESEGERPSETRKPAYLEILARGPDPSFNDGLIDILKTGSLTQKVNAAKLAGELGMKQAIPDLILLLEDRNLYSHMVFYAPMIALGQLGGPQAVQALKNAMEGVDGHLWDKVEHQYPVPEGFKEDVELIAVIQLGNMGQTQLIPELKTIFEANNWRVKPWAARAMAQMGDTSVRKWAREELTKKTDLNAFSAGQAIEALGFIGDSGDSDLIRNMEKDKSAWGRFPVQINAADYLIGMKHRTVSEQIHFASHCLEKKVIFMVPWAIEWLGRNGTPEALAALMNAINEKEFAKNQMDMLYWLRHGGVPMKRQKNGRGGYNFTSR